MPGRLDDERYSVLARPKRLRHVPLSRLDCPIQQNLLSLPTSKTPKDHAGRAGLDGEAGAKWSLSEDHVSALGT